MLFCLSRAENTSLNRYQKKGSVQKEEREAKETSVGTGIKPVHKIPAGHHSGYRSQPYGNRLAWRGS
jgi:hypothetical protein